MMGGKTVWAIFAGVAFFVVSARAISNVLHVYDFLPALDQPMNNSAAIGVTFYRLVLGVIAGLITSYLAPFSHKQFALALGCIGTILGAMFAVSTWNSGLEPRWAIAVFTVLAIPQALTGWKIYQRLRHPR